MFDLAEIFGAGQGVTSKYALHKGEWVMDYMGDNIFDEAKLKERLEKAGEKVRHSLYMCIWSIGILTLSAAWPARCHSIGWIVRILRIKAPWE